jgi:hypothetical protein
MERTVKNVAAKRARLRVFGRILGICTVLDLL